MTSQAGTGHGDIDGSRQRIMAMVNGIDSPGLLIAIERYIEAMM